MQRALQQSVYDNERIYERVPRPEEPGERQGHGASCVCMSVLCMFLISLSVRVYVYVCVGKVAPIQPCWMPAVRA